MRRREFLMSATAIAGLGFLASLGFGSRRSAAEATFPVAKTEDEWRKQLTPDQFAILRQEATERPFTSELLHNGRHGTYACVGCGTAVYASDTKFDSGTGWPSFWQALAGGVATSVDYDLVYPRTEVHCATCGGHLGHVFDDGPQPTGKRHCINGIVLAFKETAAAAG